MPFGDRTKGQPDSEELARRSEALDRAIEEVEQHAAALDGCVGCEEGERRVRAERRKLLEERDRRDELRGNE